MPRASPKIYSCFRRRTELTQPRKLAHPYFLNPCFNTRMAVRLNALLSVGTDALSAPIITSGPTIWLTVGSISPWVATREPLTSEARLSQSLLYARQQIVRTQYSDAPYMRPSVGSARVTKRATHVPAQMCRQITLTDRLGRVHTT